LGRNLDAGNGRVFGYVTDFIHLNAGLPRKSPFQLLGQRGWLGVSAGKRAHESRELRLRQIGGKVNAGDARGREQLSEAALAGCSAKRHTIEQNLISRSS
jgi:hypothetical protein